MEPKSGLVRVLKLINHVCSGRSRSNGMAHKSAISLTGSAACTPRPLQPEHSPLSVPLDTDFSA